MNLVVTHITDENREKIVNLIEAMYDKEGCGICGKRGAEVVWFSSNSGGAHKACYNQIKAIEILVGEKIEERFPDSRFNRNLAREAANTAVQNHLKNVTIKQYLDEHGAKKLKKIFDTIGVAAVNSFKP